MTVQDPVCGATVEDGNLSASCTHRGQKLFFCCEDCRQAFEKDPSRYVGSMDLTEQPEANAKT
jgi:YHS domain-containing protein